MASFILALEVWMIVESALVLRKVYFTEPEQP
jgi:hypothetical protein